MSHKIGRNDPCPCGSGKKFKYCHANPAVNVPLQNGAHEGAVVRSIHWLTQSHRKAFEQSKAVFLADAMDRLFDDLDDPGLALESLEAEAQAQLDLNLVEVVLAEGEIFVKGRYQEVSQLLLGGSGPAFTPGQRDWIEQLSRRPLRVYDVTSVTPGVGMTLCDAVETYLPPVEIAERSGSRTAEVGMQIGARLMQVADGYQLSGAVYPFSTFGGREVVARLVEEQKDSKIHPEDMPYHNSCTIFDTWLEQFFFEPEMPILMDHFSGEPMIFLTDHYRVNDWSALIAALATQSDVEGDPEHGWNRNLLCPDGLTRPLARISAEVAEMLLTVAYQTEKQADEGRAWVDALIGHSATFDHQTEEDPRQKLAEFRDNQGHSGSRPAISGLPPGMDPEILAKMIEESIIRTYRNWADEPIPMFKGRTPRQEMKTVAGMERVRGLLRMYEAGEVEQAQEQARRAISYQFLWDALGLERD